jgi:hypothetical protein
MALGAREDLKQSSPGFRYVMSGMSKAPSYSSTVEAYTQKEEWTGTMTSPINH